MLLNFRDKKQKTHDIFSEDLRPLSKHIKFNKSIPTEDDIYKFLECLFNAAELNVECAIISLVYIDRMLKSTNIATQACNWTRILLGGSFLRAKCGTITLCGM